MCDHVGCRFSMKARIPSWPSSNDKLSTIVSPAILKQKEDTDVDIVKGVPSSGLLLLYDNIRNIEEAV